MDKKVFEDGIYEITNEEYHASSGLSRSALMVFKELPMHYWHQYLSGDYEPPKPKEGYHVGSVLHTLVLEPEKFESEYFRGTKWNKATKIGKAGHAADMQAANGRIIVDAPTIEKVEAMRDALFSNPIIANLLKNEPGLSFVEQSYFWTDPETGIQCKARPDMLRLLIEPVIVDLKSCDDASPRGFQLSAIKYGYYLQMAMIFEALKACGSFNKYDGNSISPLIFKRCMFACVEKAPPYPTAVYMMQDDALHYGLGQFHSLLRQYKACQENGKWNDYGVQMLGVPRWAQNEIDYE